MQIEARNKKTQEKTLISLDEAKKLLRGNTFQIGMLEIGTSVVAQGYELRPAAEEKQSERPE